MSSSPIWHPYTPGISGNELPVNRAKDSHLFLENGARLIDAISSWWVTLHGHAHPHIAKAIGDQAAVLEQVIFSGFTHEPAERLARRLLPLLPGKMSRLFFSDNGSTAVEVALKMALQYHDLSGNKRSKVLALSNSYHGDTFGAMSVGARGPFNRAFNEWLFDVSFVNPPYSQNIDAESEARWDESLNQARAILERKEVAALIVEPLIQGAGGMLVYPKKWLEELYRLAKETGTLIIADEVFTGFYRTGKAFAGHHLDVPPDLICLSKGLTGGFMPMGITTCTEAVAAPFVPNDYAHTFYHGHSFTGNPLACAAANASLDLTEVPGFETRIAALVQFQTELAEEIQLAFPSIETRSLGTISAFSLGKELDYTHPIRAEIYPYFLDRNILIRPLGNTLYLLPPYCISSGDLQYIRETMIGFFRHIPTQNQGF